MGSRFSQLIEFELAAFNRAKRDGFNSIKASQAEFLFLGQTKRSRLSASDQDLQRQFDHASYSRKLVCYGAQGRCPDGKNMSHWRAASMKDPMPLVANFRPILSLFTAEYFRRPAYLRQTGRPCEVDESNLLQTGAKLRRWWSRRCTSQRRGAYS